MTALADSGLRWCVEHNSPFFRNAWHKMGPVAAGTPLCRAAQTAAIRTWDPLGSHPGPGYPTACRWVPLLVGTEPVAMSGQGALL